MRALVVCTALAVFLGARPAFAGQNPFDGINSPLSNEDTRLTTGVESVAAAAAKGQQHLLIDLMLTAPLGGEVTRSHKPSATAWFNARFNGSASNAVSGVKQFVGGFEKDLVSGDTATLLNTLAFRAGLEFRIPRAHGFWFGNDFQFQPTIIAAIGVQTVPALATPSLFELPKATDDPSDKASNAPYERWGIPRDKGYKYVSVGDPDRRQFYRSYEVGVRLKTHHFNDCKSPDDDGGCSIDRRRNFPGIIDLTIGQDAAVTGGVRRGRVGRVDAFYPLPTDSIANAVYLFGAIRVHWVNEVQVEEDPIILRAPAATVALPSPEVFEHTLTANERTRDEWKFGMGVDLMRLFSAAAAGRNEDKASVAREDGSATELDKNDDVSVVRRVIQPGETTTFNHGVDILMPLQNATLQAASIPAGGSGPINFVQDEARIELNTKRKLTNTTNALFEAIVVRLKPGEPRGTLPDVKKDIETVLSKPDEARYRVSRVTCPATCTFDYAADVDNTVVIVPITATRVSVGGAAAQTMSPHAPVVAGRHKAVSVTGAAEFVVVRVR